MKTLYDILGLTSEASEKDVKQTYRDLVKIWHPDVNPDPEAHETFLKIQEAYELLIDPERRAEYDLRQKQKKKQATTSYSSRSVRSEKVLHPFWKKIQAQRAKIYGEYLQKENQTKKKKINFAWQSKSIWHHYSVFLIVLWLMSFYSESDFGYLTLPILAGLSYRLGCKFD